MVEDWRNRQDDCMAKVRRAMIDFKERWEKDSAEGADAGQVGRKRKRQDDGSEIDEVDGKNTASDAKEESRVKIASSKQPHQHPAINKS